MMILWSLVWVQLWSGRGSWTQIKWLRETMKDSEQIEVKHVHNVREPLFPSMPPGLKGKAANVQYDTDGDPIQGDWWIVQGNSGLDFRPRTSETWYDAGGWRVD